MKRKTIYPVTFLLAMAMIALGAAHAPCADKSISVILAGDTIISLPWSDVREEAFVALMHEMRSADVAIVNLETLIHSFKGYPQAQSGGTWMASDPKIASELAWAGIDMVALAHNHTFDYGALGVIENTQNLKNAGIVYAGAGMDLQEARSPAYFNIRDSKVALLSTASTYVPFGVASRSRPDLHGRPGLNPLNIRSKRLYHKFLWYEWASAAGFEYYKADEEDWRGNLEAVNKAANHSDLVIVSIHAHQKEPGSRYAVPKFLQRFAHRCIENGADIFFAHGPHIPRGIEIFNGKPIFYSLGNFVLQQEMMERQPAEFYSKRGLGDQADIEDVYGSGPVKPGPEWDSFVAKVQFEKKRLKSVKLIPITLGREKPKGIRGRPYTAKDDQAQKIIGNLADLSLPFGTKIDFDGRYGLVQID